MFRPLFIVYVLFPASLLLSRTFHLHVPRNWIDGYWGMCLLFGLLSLLTSPPSRAQCSSATNRTTRYYTYIGACLFGLIVIGKFAIPLIFDNVMFVSWLMEAKPFFYILTAAILLAAFGPLAPKDFILPGVGLSCLLVGECLVLSLQSGTILRPLGSGEPNYDACLLLLSFWAGLGEKKTRYEILCIIAIGLAASMSRTAAAAATMLVLIHPGKPSLRALAALFFIAAAWLAFQTRGLTAGALEAFDRFWMWRAAYMLVMQSPESAFWGHAPGIPLPITIPDSLALLWETQKREWGLYGIHPFLLHGFFPRWVATWGICGIVMLSMFTFSFFMHHRQKAVCLALIVALYIEGTTLGLFYLSNVAIPVLLVCMCRMPSATGERKTLLREVSCAFSVKGLPPAAEESHSPQPPRSVI